MLSKRASYCLTILIVACGAEASLPERGVADLRLAAVVQRDGSRRALLVASDGAVYEVRGGERLRDGRVREVGPEAVELEAESAGARPARTVRMKLFDGGGVPSTVTEPGHTGERMSIDLEADLSSFAAIVALASGLNIVVEAGDGGPVRISARDSPWDAIVAHALRDGGFAHRIDGSYYVRVGKKETLARRPLRAQEKFSGNPVTFRVHKADMRSVIKAFETESGLAITLPPGPHAPVTMYFEDVPWDEALDVLAASRGWTTRREKGRLLVEPIRRD